MTPTARTLAYLRHDGYLAEVCERWLPRCFIRKDLFGFADCIAVKPGLPILLVQVTTGDHAANRLGKVTAAPAARTWLEAGGAIEIHGWRKGGPRGKRKLWAATVRAVTLSDLPAGPSAADLSREGL